MGFASSVYAGPMNGRFAAMRRKPMTNKEGEVRELTRADLRKFRPLSEIASPELFAMMVEHQRRRGQRGPQKSPVKDQITLRIDHDVVEYFKATGAGWQTRINQALRGSMKRKRG
jgi:uncharacterized protein (DUF4415 family)